MAPIRHVLCPNLVQHERTVVTIHKRDTRHSVREVDAGSDWGTDVAVPLPGRGAGPAPHGVSAQPPRGESA